jgi:hypothetical protein
MAMLNPEINRFLGHALLDPALARRIFSADRAKALLDYNLLPEVSAAIMTSKARTLHELACELSVAFAVASPADAEREAEKVYQAVRPNAKPITIRQVQAVAQKVIDRTSITTPAAEEEYAQLKSA